MKRERPGHRPPPPGSSKAPGNLIIFDAISEEEKAGRPVVGPVVDFSPSDRAEFYRAIIAEQEAAGLVVRQNLPLGGRRDQADPPPA